MQLNKLLKWRERFIAFTLAFTIPLSGCAVKDNNFEDSSLSSKSLDSLDKSNMYDVFENVTMKQELDITKEDYQKFINMIYDIVPVYNYEENYITYENIEKIIEASKNQGECPNKISEDYIQESKDLFLKIKENSKNYLETHSEYKPCFENDTDDKFYIEPFYFEPAFQIVIDKLIRRSTNNVAEDICVLENLVVVNCKIEETADAIYDQNKNIIYFDINKIFYTNTADINESMDNLTKTIEHEINHVRQMACQHRTNDIIKSIQYSDEITTLIESSAESAFLYERNYNYDNTFVYGLERQDEGLLFLLALFNDSTTLEEYYNAIFDSNLNNLYKFYDLNSEEEIQTFYKILYAIDTKNCRTNLFNSWLEETGGITIKEIETRTGTSYLIDLFRLTLRRMIDYTYTHDDFSLETNLKMFVIVKSLILDNSYTLERTENAGEIEYKKNYEPTFVENFNRLELLYVDFLKEVYNVTYEELRIIENEIDIYELHNFHEFLKDSDIDIEKEFAKNELINKFPILKGIVTTNYPNTISYQEFLESNNLSLNRSLN